MNSKKISLMALAVLSAVSLSGCSWLNVGEEHFSCDGMPGSVYCHSARDVYEKTNSGVVPSPVGKASGAYNPDCDDCVRAEDVNPDLAIEEDEQSQYAVDKNGKRLKIVEGHIRTDKKGNRYVVNGGDEVINNYVTPALPDQPVPIRTPAQIMRIWIAPYVDTMGDLIAPGFVYTEVEPRRWIYPEDEDRSYGKNFQPLKTLNKAKTYRANRSYSKKAGTNSLLEFRKKSAEKLKTMSVNNN